MFLSDSLDKLYAYDDSMHRVNQDNKLIFSAPNPLSSYTYISPTSSTPLILSHVCLSLSLSLNDGFFVLVYAKEFKIYKDL